MTFDHFLNICSVYSAKCYKTIHHFCTTPVSQIVPVELQLASRLCHTQNLATATPQLDQQMAAPGQLSPEIKRYFCVQSNYPLGANMFYVLKE